MQIGVQHLPNMPDHVDGATRVPRVVFTFLCSLYSGWVLGEERLRPRDSHTFSQKVPHTHSHTCKT